MEANIASALVVGAQGANIMTAMVAGATGGYIIFCWPGHGGGGLKPVMG